MAPIGPWPGAWRARATRRQRAARAGGLGAACLPFFNGAALFFGLLVSCAVVCVCCECLPV